MAKMFFLGDKVILNKYTVKKHVPQIDIDVDLHEIIDFEIYNGIKYYVLSGFEDNYFIAEELIDIDLFLETDYIKEIIMKKESRDF